MHIGIICPELIGHLNPMMSLGRELVRRGHRVSVLATYYAHDLVARGQLERIELPATDALNWAAHEAWQRVGEQSGIRAFLRTFKVLTRSARQLRAFAPDVLRGSGIEGLIVDQFSPSGALVADALRLPYVVACNALASNRDLSCPPPPLSWKYRPTWFGRCRNWLGYQTARIMSNGFDLVRPSGFVPPLLLVSDPDPWGLALICQQPAAFDFPRGELPNHFHYTGPWHEPRRDQTVEFPWHKLDQRPLVYASLGTIQNKRRHIYQAIVRAARGLDIQMVLALGSRETTQVIPASDNVIVVPFAPQLELLDRAAAAITHAGLNTALECLSRGVPMLCMPITNDQPGVARRVEWLGAGRYLSLWWASERRIRRELNEVLSQPSYRVAAEKLKQEFARIDGLKRAADIVEQALTTGRRVRRA